MRIAVVGLGRMGAAIARRIQGAGHELWVWNRSAGPVDEFLRHGANVLGSPAEALSRAEVAITMVSDSAAVEDVTIGPAGILSGATGGTLVEMSTISVNASSAVAAEAGRRGVAYLRAPVSGNPAVVAAGALSIVVSGPRGVFETVSPLLSDIGPNLFYVGDGEQARVVKLALNLIIGGTAELLAEALVLAEQNGIARRDMLEVISGSAVGSPFVGYKTESLIADDYTSTFTARLLAKDLNLALDCAAASQVPLPLTVATLELVRDCIDQGMGDDDLMALLPRLRRAAGLDG